MAGRISWSQRWIDHVTGNWKGGITCVQIGRRAPRSSGRLAGFSKQGLTTTTTNYQHKHSYTHAHAHAHKQGHDRDPTVTTNTQSPVQAAARPLAAASDSARVSGAW